MQIFISTPSMTDTFKVDVEQGDTIDAVKRKIEATQGFEFGRQRLAVMHTGSWMENLSTISSNGVQSGDTLYMELRGKKIFVGAKDGNFFVLDVDPTDTILKVKQILEGQEGISVRKQELRYNGCVLCDGLSLADADVDDEANIDLVELQS
ncbi:unnamed protein product [Choristocarpus tenellus]